MTKAVPVVKDVFPLAVYATDTGYGVVAVVLAINDGDSTV